MSSAELPVNAVLAAPHPSIVHRVDNADGIDRVRAAGAVADLHRSAHARRVLCALRDAFLTDELCRRRIR
ncbi:hypothetical protein HNR05_000051 [Leifsonia psychrotolerans]|uniref:Uncharacterized protein n=1 Tax=Glaciibacter psychrotolerans TaxID=670054 RepID=A0A7Z0J4E2_9MICO|nr:hypothetical protein [Leifsonia psychrotolerans]